MSKTRTTTRKLTECALLIAVGTVLAQIKIFEMPFGGSVTLLSMVPFILASLRHGTRWGLLTGAVNGILQMLLGFYAPPAGTIPALIGVVLLDYMLAFMVLGLAAWFAARFKKPFVGVVAGTAIVCFLRFVCSFLSGALLWGSYQSYYEWANGMSVWLYSFLYNGGYMLPELLLTTIAVALIYRAAPRLFEAQK